MSNEIWPASPDLVTIRFAIDILPSGITKFSHTSDDRVIVRLSARDQLVLTCSLRAAETSHELPRAHGIQTRESCVHALQKKYVVRNQSITD